MNVCPKSVKKLNFSLSFLLLTPFVCKIFEGSAFKLLYFPFSDLKFLGLLMHASYKYLISQM